MHELVCQAKSLLETQIDAVPAMEKLAASLGLSTRHFYRVFREHTGLSPYQYHLQLRIERAKQMLHGTGMSVKEVAARIGLRESVPFFQSLQTEDRHVAQPMAQSGTHREKMTEKRRCSVEGLPNHYPGNQFLIKIVGRFFGAIFNKIGKTNLGSNPTIPQSNQVNEGTRIDLCNKRSQLIVTNRRIK